MKRLRRIAASLALVAGTAWAGDGSVSLIFAGDVMLDDGPGRLIADGGDPLAAVAPLLADADYRIANLECSVSTRGASLPGKPYTFRADPRALRVMQGRFDAVALSNNHSGDFGPDAFLDTIDHLRQAGLRSFGGTPTRPCGSARTASGSPCSATTNTSPAASRPAPAAPAWPGARTAR